MKAITVLKKFITVITCSSLIVTQIALAESPPPEQPAAQETSSENKETSDVSMETKQTNEANYCQNDPAFQPKIRSCESERLQFNCHLQRCVTASDNEIYNKEYNDCNSSDDEGEQKSCKDNLKKVANEIDSHNSNMDENEDVASKGKKASMGENIGTVAGAANMVALGMILLGKLSAPVCYSGKTAMGVSALAFMYQLSAKGKYKAKFKAAVDMMKNIDKSDKKGWNHNSQVATVDMEIRALELIKEAAEEKMKYHKVLMTLSAVSLTVAGIEIAECSVPKPDPSCGARLPCAGYTAGFAAAGLAMEGAALSFIKGRHSDAKKAITEAKKLRTKLQSLYNIDSDSMIMLNPQLAAGSGVGQLQISKVSSAGDAQTNVENGQDFATNSCINSNDEVSSCPCADGGCKKFDLNLPGNSGLEAQISKKMNFAGYESGLNAAANGNIAALDFAAKDGNLALANSVNRRLIEKILDNKKLDPKIKSTLETIQGGIKNEADINKVASFNSPLQNALTANKLGYFGKNGNLALGKVSDSSAKDAGKVSDKDKKETKKLATFQKNGLSDIEKRLKALQDGINLDDLDTVNNPDLQFGQGNNALVDKGLKNSDMEVDTQQAVVHPDEKISIFKIITNRYNILRSKKRFAK